MLQLLRKMGELKWEWEAKKEKIENKTISRFTSVSFCFESNADESKRWASKQTTGPAKFLKQYVLEESLNGNHL